MLFTTLCLFWIISCLSNYIVTCFCESRYWFINGWRVPFHFQYFSLASCKQLDKFQNRFSKKNQSSSYTLYFISWNCSEQWFSFWSLLDCKKIKYSSVIFLLQNLWRGKRIFKLFFISLCFLNFSDKFTSDIVFFVANTINNLRECIMRKL